MDTQALFYAGLIGSFVAVVHGILMQKKMIAPLLALANENKLPRRVVGLLTPLMHFSTFVWFTCGVALMVVAVYELEYAYWTLNVTASIAFAYGAIFNFIGTRGRHPGWVLLAISVGLLFMAH